MISYNKDIVCEEYLKYLNKQNLNKSSILAYYLDFKILLNEIETDLNEIFKLSNIYKFINSPTIKYSTMKRRRVSIKKILIFLKQNSYITDIDYLMANIKNHSSVIENISINEDVLSDYQVKKILNFNEISTNFLRDKAILETIYTLGLRTDELINLKLENIDINLRLISFYRGPIKKTIPLDISYNEALIKYVTSERNISHSDSEYLFLSRNNDKFSRQSIWKIINKISKKSGIDIKVTPKILRKSFAISLVKKGAPIDFVSDFFGVKNINYLLKENVDKNEYYDLMKFFINNNTE